MQIKQFPEDFVVEELYDIEKFKEKDEGGDVFYFILEKRDYAQLKALDTISRIFDVSRKNIHFAGTKDKKALTRQVISISNIKPSWRDNLEYFNEKVKDIKLEYLGIFKGRINLGDNLGNKFIITIRDLKKEEIEKIKENSKNLEKGIPNYFDKQRFGFANNSHVVGKYVLQNNLEAACKDILTSTSKGPTEDVKEYVQELERSWDKIKEADQKEISRLISIMPRFYRDERKILQHLHNYKNDFPGAFRTIHKKLRTLYIAAYQSYLFNETIKNFDLEGEFELFNSETRYSKEIQDFVEELLKKDNLTQESLNLSSMPELKPIKSMRNVRAFPKNFKIVEEGEDKLIVSFELGPGEYATNVISYMTK